MEEEKKDKGREMVIDVKMTCFIKMNDAGTQTDAMQVTGIIKVPEEYDDVILEDELISMLRDLLTKSRDHKPKKIVLAQNKLIH